MRDLSVSTQSIASVPQTVTQYCYPSGTCVLDTMQDGLLNGFGLLGETQNEYLGYTVSAAGDVNGDGCDDFIISTTINNAYVVFGSLQSNAWGSGKLPLSTLMDGQRGFILQGADSFYRWTFVSGAGDINGDGLGDVMVGLPAAQNINGVNSGNTYVVFGSNQPNAWGTGVLNLNTLADGQHGFVLQGEATNNYSGMSVSRAGDVNGDGCDDLIIGAPNAGKAYIVFGSNQTNAWGSGVLDLSTLMDGQRGFMLNGEMTSDGVGSCVSTAGDINGDKINDLLIGASVNIGKTYVIFGSNQTTAWEAGIFNIDSLMNGQQGFVLSANGIGASASSAGDFNNDGLDDVLIGASGGTSVNGASGITYLVFGSNQPDAWGTGAISLTTLMDGQKGFMLIGKDEDYIGIVSPGGDINRDGFDDSLIGGSNGGNNNYIVFGSNQTNLWESGVVDLSNINAWQGFVLRQTASSEGVPYISAADINGDNVNDVIIGSPNTDSFGLQNSGKTYIIFGRSSETFRFTANQLRLQEGQTIILNNDMLAVESNTISIDATALASIPFSVENVLHGHFAIISEPAIPITSFYQQNISAGQIQFTHDGSTPFAPSYGVVVNTTLLRTSSDAQIDFLGYPPSPIHWEALYTSVSTVGGILLSIAGYIWWRRRVASHRHGYDFANALRKAANLEYHDFTRFDGEVYKTRVGLFLAQLKPPHRDFYDLLTSAEQNSFAVCLTEILKEHSLLLPSGCGSTLYGWFFGFSAGRSQQLDMKEFGMQMNEIAQQAVAAWRAEEDPLNRWPYYSLTTKDKVKAWCCCSRPSQAGMFAGGSRLPEESAALLQDIKHSEVGAAVSLGVQRSSIRFTGDTELTIFKREMAAQLQQISGRFDLLYARMDRLEQGAQPPSQGLSKSS